MQNQDEKHTHIFTEVVLQEPRTSFKFITKSTKQKLYFNSISGPSSVIAPPFVRTSSNLKSFLISIQCIDAPILAKFDHCIQEL